METGDRLTLIGIGAAVTIAIVTGNCTANQRLGDVQRSITALERRLETGFSEAANQRREEHRQITGRLERLEDLHLKPIGATGQ